MKAEDCELDARLVDGLEQFGFNVLEAITDGFVAFDADWRFIYANRVARKMFERNLVGDILWEAFPHLLGTEIETAYRRAVAEGVPVQLEHYDEGRGQWMDLRAFPTRDGLAVLSRDISARKQRVSDLEGMEHQFRELADAMPQIVWSAKPNGDIEFLNARWYEFTGEDPGTPVWEQYGRAIHPEDIQGHLQDAWAEALRNGEPYECEIRIRSQEGEYRWHLSRTVPVRDEEGAVLRFYGTSTDIHDRKLAEVRLALSERRFQVALSGAQITAYEQDEQLRYTWLYPRNEYFEARSMGHNDAELLPEAEGKELTELKGQVLKTGKGARKTIKASTADGTHFYDLMVQPLRDASGEVVGVTGAALDVTDRTQAETALRESEERFRQAIENSPIPKIIHAEDGEFLYASRAWGEMTGYPAEETRTLDEWVRAVGAKAPNLGGAFEAAFQRTDGRDDAGEYTIRTRSGHELIWIITSAPLGVLPDGRRLAVTAGIDITSRKWTEEGQRFLTQAGRTLAESLDFEQTLTTIARLAVPILADWCAVDIVQADKSLKRVAVAHVDPEQVKWAHEIQEKYPTDMSAPTGVPNVLRTAKSEVISEVTQEMIDAANLDEEMLEIIRKVEIASMVIVPLIAREDALGAISFVSSVPGRYEERDVTIFEELGRMAGLAVENARLYGSVQAELDERRRAEEEIRRLNDSLNERVKERTAELVAANKEMEGFTYSVSHDLRAPLRAIMSTSMILLDEAGPGLNAQERELLMRQAAAAKKMGVLIDELLKLSRLARQEMVSKPLDLSLIADDIVEELRGEGRASEITFDIRRDIAAKGDVRLLRFVLLNLIENAVKFSPNGGTVTVGEKDDVYFVRDEGIGFDIAYADKLFLPFERLVNDTEFPGTGIGLANVQRIVHRHGGKVWAESEPGKGATFFFTLD